MFDIGAPEVLVIIVIAVLVFGPDKLPDFARTVAKLLKQGRQLVANAQNELKNELGDSVGDFDVSDIRNLNPRTMLKNTLLGDGGTEQFRDLNPFNDLNGSNGSNGDKPVTGSMESHTPKPQKPLEAGERPPFDIDAT